MKNLKITAIATACGIGLLLVVIKMIDAPLGGQPYSIISIKERKEAETSLANQKKKSAEKKAKEMANNPEKKQPSYFKKADDEKLTANKMNGKDAPQQTAKTKIPAGLNDVEKQQALDNMQNQLEYLARIGLPPAPNPDLIEQTKYGMLPRISDAGKRPLDVYKRPANPQHKNKKSIAIVITGLGLSQPLTENALDKLPPEITFSFNPYANQLKNWARRSRRAGHEIILEVPLEPFDYPDNDPGPHTLLTYQADKVNIEHLNWLMGRMPGYIGLINLDGGKYLTDENAVYSMMREIKDRGLLYMDANPERPEMSQKISQEIKLEYVNSTLIIDHTLSKQAINTALAKLEKAATRHGLAIGRTQASPLAIKEITEWAETLKAKGITLIPLSSTIPDNQS